MRRIQWMVVQGLAHGLAMVIMVVLAIPYGVLWVVAWPQRRRYARMARKEY